MYKKFVVTLCILLLGGSVLFAQTIPLSSKLTVINKGNENLSASEKEWLPGAVCDKVSENFLTYTGYSLVSSDTSAIRKAQKASESAEFSESDVIEIGKISVAKYAIFVTLRKSGSGYSVAAEVTDLTTGEKKATATSSVKKTDEALYSNSSCAANEITVKLCDQLGIPLSQNQRTALLNGESDVSVENQAQLAIEEENAYRNAIAKYDEEIKRLAASTDVNATAAKAKAEADKAMAEAKMKAAQERAARLAEEAKKAAADKAEDAARTAQQKQKRDEMAQLAAQKAAEVRARTLENESIYTKIGVIESKKKAMLDIQAAYDARVAEIKKEYEAEYQTKKKEIESAPYRTAEKNPDGTPSETAKTRRKTQVENLRKETDSQIASEIAATRAPAEHSVSELYIEIQEDLENIGKTQSITSLTSDLKVQFDLFNATTNSWRTTFWLYSNGMPVCTRSFNMDYKDLTGNDVDVSSDTAYDTFLDTVDLYNSLFSRGEPVVTVKVDYHAESVSEQNSKYRFVIDKVHIIDTVSGSEKSSFGLKEPVTNYESKPSYGLKVGLLNVSLVDSIKAGKDALLSLDNDMVTILRKKYKMLKTEVTQELYMAIMGENPSWHKGDNLPVENVNWYDAIYFCNKLSITKGLSPVYAVDGQTDITKWNYTPHKKNEITGTITQNASASGYRLPTEEEWEYAAKGGRNYTYAGSNNLNEVGWYRDNSGDKTHPVAQKKPNGYGLYDMTGNVWEWCWDSRGDYNRYSRGGSYSSYGSSCEVGIRNYYGAYNQDRSLGFRIVCSPSK